MPRLRPSLFWTARRDISPFAALLLRVCRDVPSAANELRWIREHIALTSSPAPPKFRLWKLCEKRAKGTPLQYVLGTQPFGGLEIKCRPGVLIPRHETEAYTTELAQILVRHQPSSSTPLSILDLCTGTGCIALGLLSLLPSPVHIHGIDISPTAISLANTNLHHNTRLGLLPPQPSSIHFTPADIFSPFLLPFLTQPTWDLLISNPPYISRGAFARETARAVRNYEPRLALVPDRDGETAVLGCASEDVFYARLLQLAGILAPRRVFFEVAGIEQAARVVDMVRGDARLSGFYPQVEIWRDSPHEEYEMQRVRNYEVPFRGSGGARGVYLCRHDQR
ncbi:S-adenosyl-L-methionine-dependent methyltransferase [Lasiosphaeria hispida]|uniref:peptide chain release factor N(5)-glutamine methyltransferase n=1 Tax=Lasiosphaeria hispida TaxID=260671 RepID=A0AAJ0HR68_9PEZI|nr:S-adenosyl-L-methionine-dependent methyltransferase [Lasiosphaeria hispida]